MASYTLTATRNELRAGGHVRRRELNAPCVVVRGEADCDTVAGLTCLAQVAGCHLDKAARFVVFWGVSFLVELNSMTSKNVTMSLLIAVRHPLFLVPRILVLFVARADVTSAESGEAV